MADKRSYNQYNGSNSYGGYPMMGNPYGGNSAKSSAGNKKLSKKEKKKQEAKAQRKEYNATMRARQNYAIENATYRNKVAAIDGQGGIDSRYYKLPADVKPKKERDYFFVMRKFVCFLMFLLLLVSIAYFALNFVKIEAIPPQFTALYMETEAKAEESDDTEEEDEVAPENADDAEADDEDEEEDEEGGSAAEFDGTAYSAIDPIFGFIKYVGNQLGMELDFGESPLYDSMISKVEVGMEDTIASYMILAFPVALIIYILTAFIMMLKAFFGMFGKRIFKCFGLGSIVMILCGVITALGGLAFVTDVVESMNFGGITDILLGAITGVGGFTGGYGLLIIIVLPVLTLIFSMFARKKIPYSIFDTFGE